MVTILGNESGTNITLVHDTCVYFINEADVTNNRTPVG